LPAALITDWQPISKVLFSFGAMTVTPTEITWDSGQTSPYRVLNQEGGFLLQLEANPKFYDTPNAYLKLIPKTNEAGATTGVDVAFYESEAQVQTDEYVMYGSYSLLTGGDRHHTIGPGDPATYCRPSICYPLGAYPSR
jgi:hypothetical protein